MLDVALALTLMLFAFALVRFIATCLILTWTHVVLPVWDRIVALCVAPDPDDAWPDSPMQQNEAEDVCNSDRPLTFGR